MDNLSENRISDRGGNTSSTPKRRDTMVAVVTPGTTVPETPAQCPSCNAAWPVGDLQCPTCGSPLYVAKQILETQRMNNLQSTPPQHLRNLNMANFRLLQVNPAWSPRKRSMFTTLMSVLAAFFLAILVSFITVGLGLDTVEFYTPWWDIPVPTGAGIVVFVVVLIIALFTQAKK